MSSDNVQRAKSARWLQGNVTYDGGGYGGDDYDDWDDENGDDYNDDDGVPPLPPNVPKVPSIPAEYLTSTKDVAAETADPIPLPPDTSIQQPQSNDVSSGAGHLAHTKSNGSNKSQTFVEAGVRKYSLQDGVAPQDERESSQPLNIVNEHDNEARHAESSSALQPPTSNLPGAWPSSSENLPVEQSSGSWPSSESKELPGAWPQASTSSLSLPPSEASDDKAPNDEQSLPKEEFYPTRGDNDNNETNRQSTYDHEEIYDQYYDEPEEEPQQETPTLPLSLPKALSPPPQFNHETNPAEGSGTLKIDEPQDKQVTLSVTPPVAPPVHEADPIPSAIPSAYLLHPTNTNEFYGETDSTASLSTGRRSMDSNVIDQRGRLSIEDNRPALHGRIISESVRNNPVMEDSEEDINEQLNEMSLKKRPDLQDSSDSDSDSDIATGGLTGRWKPDPLSIPSLHVDNTSPSTITANNNDYSSPDQNHLEKEILDSINGNSKSEVYLDKTPSPSRVEDYSPDPEFIQLVKDTRMSQVGFPEIKPLNTNRSKGSNESDDNNHWGNSSSDDDDDNSKSEIKEEDEEEDNDYDDERNHHTDKTLHVIDTSHDHNRLSDDISSIATGVSEPETISPTSTNEINNNANDPRPRQVSQAGSVLSTNTTVMNPIAIKLNKQPTFDFAAALTKPNSADRKQLFDSARLQQADYSANLQSWLLAVSTPHQGVGVYSTGTPPKPTQNEAKEDANSQRIVSATTFIKPARNITNQFGKVGEKSTKKAKGLFAKFIGNS